MDINTINTRIDNLYNQKWANLNTWYPVGLWKAAKNEASKIYNLLNTATEYSSAFESIVPNLCSNIQNIVSIKNIPNTSTGVSYKNTTNLEIVNQPNAAMIDIDFYIEQDLKTWKFLQNWRKDWLDISFNTNGPTISKSLKTVNNTAEQACPEGYLELKYINITSDGIVEDLGILKLFGLIPTTVPFIGSVGPGVSRQTDLPKISCRFLISNAVYISKDGEVIYLY